MVSSPAAPYGPEERGKAFILGSGGHARAVQALAAEVGYIVEFFLDPWASLIEVNGLSVLTEAPATAMDDPPTPILGVGNNHHRRDLYIEMVKDRALTFPTLIHPKANVASSCSIGPGSVVFPGAVIGSGARVGVGSIANSLSIIEHDSAVGDFVSLGPGAVLCGGVQVGELASIGANATVLPQVTIGAEATLGAMSLALHHLPSGEVWVGSPARRVSAHKG